MAKRKELELDNNREEEPESEESSSEESSSDDVPTRSLKPTLCLWADFCSGHKHAGC